jgi:LysM repeat protein
MTDPSPSTPTKVCPTCGTRLSENAAKCTVCGRVFSVTGDKKANKAVQGPRMPQLTLSLPIALALIILLLGAGAGAVYATMQTTGVEVAEPTATVTETLTPTVTLTEAPTLTATPEPTWTPLPDFEYIVKEGEFCRNIAVSFGVSIQSIVLANNLPSDCGILSAGQKLMIPQPTLTPSPQPTATLSGADATEAACEKFFHTVGETDTLSSIAMNYNVSMETIKIANGLSSDVVFQGAVLTIPLCERLAAPGPTATATPPPPYAAANLLLPADGAAFMANNDVITLQWASVGTLRENEVYSVSVEDITDGSGRKLVEYVTDTKFIVPSSFRPRTGIPHIIRWHIVPVRQIGSTQDGNAIYEPAGTASAPRVFSWMGSTGGAAAPTPEP